MDPEVLKKAPLFAGLEDDAATALSSAMGKLHLNKGDVLFHEGDSEDRLYIVVSGKIGMHTSVPFAEDVYIGTIGAVACGAHRVTFVVPVAAPGGGVRIERGRVKAIEGHRRESA